MRFAFKTSPQETTWTDMLAVWKVADDIELFESGWTFDHFYPIFSDSTGPCMEGWITLTALAQATTRLRLGTLVTGIHYRHPAILANMATTLDIVSGGRLELGIGAGWNEEESGAYGIELGTPGQRSDRFEEACEVIVGLLTQETTTFAGRYYQLSEARNEPKPVQRPHPPICVGGSGERRTLRTAARFAQHWNFVGGTPEEFAASGMSCISTARASAATPRRFSSPVTSDSRGTRGPPPNRPPPWPRSAPTWALSPPTAPGSGRARAAGYRLARTLKGGALGQTDPPAACWDPRMSFSSPLRLLPLAPRALSQLRIESVGIRHTGARSVATVGRADQSERQRSETGDDHQV